MTLTGPQRLRVGGKHWTLGFSKPCGVHNVSKHYFRLSFIPLFLQRWLDPCLRSSNGTNRTCTAAVSPSAHHMRSAATQSRWGSPHTTSSPLTRPARAHRLPAALGASEQRLGGHAAAASPRANSTTRVRFTSQPNNMPADSAAAPAAPTATSSRPPASWRRPYSPGPLTEAEFEAYWQDGFVIKRGLLSQEDIDPCLAAIERCVCGGGG